MEALASLLRSSSKDTALSLCSSLIPLIHEIGNKHGVKFFDNYNYRTFAMYKEVKEIWEDIQLGEKRTGIDSSSVKYSLRDIEFKTGNDDKGKDPLKTSFMWDKQAEEVRRKETLASDAFVLGRFEFESLRIILVAKEPATLARIRTKMHEKQEVFMKKWNTNIQANKRGGSDAIRLNYDELLCDDVWWDLWVDGTWWKHIRSADCILKIATTREKKRGMRG